MEADECGYQIDGVLLSDFVTPGWFEPTQADRVDFKRHVSRTLEMAPGGYTSIFDTVKGWTQISAGQSAREVPVGSRRQRRAMSREQWGRSVR